MEKQTTIGSEWLDETSDHGVVFFTAVCIAGVACHAQQLMAASTIVQPTILLRPSACPCSRCYVAETPNFRIYYCTSAERMRELAESCERLKTRCQSIWLGTSDNAWVPRCEIVVHSTVNVYRRALGPGSERTTGCSTIRIENERVAERRIDLRSDAEDWLAESLPHELTHVVLADRFTTRAIPAWADEGIAMLAESNHKLHRRLNELQGAVAAGHAFGLRELVTLENGPSFALRDAFYGQSVTLAAILLERGTTEQLMRFFETGQRDGYDEALQKVYGDVTWNALESDWRMFVRSQRLRNYAQHSFPEKPGQQRSVKASNKAVLSSVVESAKS